MPLKRITVMISGRGSNLAALVEATRSGGIAGAVTQVGGDFYDCFKIDERHVFFVVADVSGKGLPAALFMASAKSHLKSAALRGGTLGEVLTDDRGVRCNRQPIERRIEKAAPVGHRGFGGCRQPAVEPGHRRRRCAAVVADHGWRRQR